MSVLVGDCVEVMAGLEASSVDAIVCDPPYGLEFMGKDWDRLGDVGKTSHQGFADEPGFKGFRLAPYSGSSNVKCGRCSRWRWDHEGRRCECGPAAIWPNVKALEGRRMQEWHERWAREALRVLKPGGHLLAFGGTRTYHRLMAGVEDAGFEVRDCVMWLYGSGFPKSLDVGKAIDKAARGVPQGGADPSSANHGRFKTQATEGSRGDGDAGRGYGAGPGQFMAEAGEREERELVAEARPWEGWGTALKPAWEPVVVARKPLVGTVAGNVLAHGTGALNIDACRIGWGEGGDKSADRKAKGYSDAAKKALGGVVAAESATGFSGEVTGSDASAGRWPANVVLSHDEDCVLVGERQVRADGHHPAARGASGYGSAVPDSNGGGLKGHDGLEERHADGEVVQRWACVPGCPVRMLDEQAGELVSGANPTRRGSDKFRGVYADFVGQEECTPARGVDRGGPSRFYYCAKAGRAERNAGLLEFEKKPILWSSGEQNPGSFQAEGTERAARNLHPTVKPIDLMRWLIRLVTPPGGRVLDPFAGSGSTGCAAALEGVEFVGIERDADYAAIADARIRFWREHPTGLPVEQALEAEGKRRRVRESGQLGFGV